MVEKSIHGVDYGLVNDIIRSILVHFPQHLNYIYVLGTMGPSDANGDVIPHKGALYSLNKGVVTKHKCNIGISNGLAWDTTKMKMYYCDTMEPKIFQYDISKDGKISWYS